MKIITNLAIPDNVYLFYYDLAKYLPNCTTEDIIADSLERYMNIVSADIIQKVLNECSEDSKKTAADNQTSPLQ